MEASRCGTLRCLFFEHRLEIDCITHSVRTTLAAQYDFEVLDYRRFEPPQVVLVWALADLFWLCAVLQD